MECYTASVTSLFNFPFSSPPPHWSSLWNLGQLQVDRMKSPNMMLKLKERIWESPCHSLLTEYNTAGNAFLIVYQITQIDVELRRLRKSMWGTRELKIVRLHTRPGLEF